MANDTQFNPGLGVEMDASAPASQPQQQQQQQAPAPRAAAPSPNPVKFNPGLGVEMVAPAQQPNQKQAPSVMSDAATTAKSFMQNPFRTTGQVLSGVGAGAMSDVQDAVVGASKIINPLVGLPGAQPFLSPKLTENNTPEERTGAHLETLGSLYLPAEAAYDAAASKVAPVAGKVASTASDWLDAGREYIAANEGRAKQALDAVESAAGKAPVQISQATKDLLVRYGNLADAGGGEMAAPKKLIERLADPSKPDISFAQARDFQKNLSSLSGSERMAMKGEMGATIKRLAGSFHNDLKATADMVKPGLGDQYEQAISEYAKSQRMKDMWLAVKTNGAKALWQAAKLGLAGGIAGGIYNDLSR